jgi:hypothetical protein
LQQQEAPRALAQRARELGMVATGGIAFVEVRKHGKIVGVVEPAPPPAPPAPEPTSSAKTTTDEKADADKPAAETKNSRDGQKPDGHRRADKPERG